MKHYFWILGALLFSLPFAQAENRREWKFGLTGRSSDDTLSSSKMVGPFALARVHHEFTPALESDFVGGVRLETGSSSSLFTNEFAPRSRFLLEEASLRWKLFEPFSLRAGAINQSHHESPLLVAGGPFPAAIAAFDFRRNNFLLHLDGQAAIPTGENLSSKSVGKEATPTLFTQKLKVGYDDEEWMLQARATHFDFSNLTRGIAQDSRFYGNEVVGVGTGSQFFYRYSGYEAGGDARVPLSKSFLWGLGASFLVNTKGPKNADEGRYFYTDFTWRGEGFTLRPKFELYRNESDASPAFYSSREFGHNNRKGTGAVLGLELPKAGVDLEFKYRKSDLIQPRTFQRDRFEFFELTVEIPYVGF